jgi:hypothetical protein
MDDDIAVNEIDVVEDIDQFLLADFFGIAYVPALFCPLVLGGRCFLADQLIPRQPIVDMLTQRLPCHFAYSMIGICRKLLSFFLISSSFAQETILYCVLLLYNKPFSPICIKHFLIFLQRAD